ncbi:unnamed protein product [Dovyalis caffra]|uniref:Uncharacterized protein n=1 Tax=Dovyalis caffra TaxID=77055 RepID=A0AAV1R8R3_9ROSI|nr:unnamed protein product [Dovyalis caffra]
MIHFALLGGCVHPDDEMAKRKSLSFVSIALVLAVAIDVFKALAMYLGLGIFLNTMAYLL